MIEGRLERYIESVGASVDDFYAAAADDAGSGAFTGESFVAVLNAATSFEVFAALMVDARNGEFGWVGE